LRHVRVAVVAVVGGSAEDLVPVERHGEILAAELDLRRVPGSGCDLAWPARDLVPCLVGRRAHEEDLAVLGVQVDPVVRQRARRPEDDRCGPNALTLRLNVEIHRQRKVGERRFPEKGH